MCRLHFNLEESCGGGVGGISAFTASLRLELGPLLHQLIGMFFRIFLQFCSPGFLEVCHSLNAPLSPFFIIYFPHHRVGTLGNRGAEAGPRGPRGVSWLSDAIRSAPD